MSDTSLTGQDEARQALADQKEKAHGAVSRALKSGRLERPYACEDCGDIPPRARDGRTQIQGHHFLGYEHPLEVKWLCVKCHRKETPVANGSNNGWHTTPSSRTYGSKNGFSKITEAIAVKIHADKRQSKIIAQEYGLATGTVRSIRRGATWGAATSKQKRGGHG